MVIGMIPLMFSTGVGANGNTTIGTGVVGGMVVGTLALLFVLPVFYAFFQWLQDKIRAKKESKNEIIEDKTIEEEVK
jgi:Cu/Ag efflux pump CusA